MKASQVELIATANVALRELLESQGDNCINQVENEYTKNKDFSKLLKVIEKGNMANNIWEKIQILKKKAQSEV